MCLITEWKKPRVAKRDITVYKEVYPKSEDTCTSVFQSFTYIYNEKYVCEMKETHDIRFPDTHAMYMYTERYPEQYKEDICKTYSLKSIGEGFHSYLSLRRATEPYYDNIIAKAIIPKGSLYYKDISGLVVSNQIIIIKKKECYENRDGDCRRNY